MKTTTTVADERKGPQLFVGLTSAAVLIAVVAAGRGFAQQEDRAAEGAGDQGKAKNVMLLIGDGVGESGITIARNYEKGATGRLAVDGLPEVDDYTTYSVREDEPSKPD